MTRKNKNVSYEIIIWTGSNIGSIGIYEITESKQAINHYNENVKNGLLESYITVKKHNEADKCGDYEEFGNEMGDCTPMCFLPKYVKKALGDIVTMVALELD